MLVVTSKPQRAKTKIWLQKHNKDPYVKESRKNGFRSRASFKLLEIQERFQLVESDHTVIDLGCAPGGWSVLLAEMVGKNGLVIGVDRLSMSPIEGVLHIINDVASTELPDQIQHQTGGKAINGVFSDIAPNTTGHKKVDRLRMIQAIEEIWAVVQDLLEPNGYFAMKIRDGTLEHTLQQQMKKQTQSLRVFKPDASRNSSSEVYLIGTGFQKL